MVTIYTITTCPWCDKVKKYLEKNKVEYVAKNIEIDEVARKECLKISGDLVVPITTVNGKDYVLSYDKEKLDTLLGL